ncbi:MAG: hypothetical protein K8J08_16955 [Thermoanaerobaculia bacterium]|nr:hypothetical protein [Thermoanaerobaculia bacterium]
MTITQPMRRLLLTLALTLVLTPGLASASTVDAVLGSEGELFQVFQGNYGDLFPDGTEAQPDHSVLALDITWPSQVTERLLVPGTEGMAVEMSPSLTLERSSGAIFIVWEATRTIHSELYIVGRSNEEWSEVLEFSGSPFTTKSNPRLAPTHERSFVTNDDGELEEHLQTILHLTWWDEQGEVGRVLYVPLIVGKSGFVAVAPISLGEFLDEDLPPASTSPLSTLLGSPFIQEGSDNSHVLIAYLDPSSGRLVTLSTRFSSASLDALADEARAQVIIIGGQVQTREQLAQGVHAAVASVSYLDSALAEYLGQQAESAVLAAPPEATLTTIAQEARAQVIIIGSRVRSALSNTTGEARAQVIIIGDSHPGLDHGRSIAIEMINSREVPDLPEAAIARLLLSPDGHTMIVAWQQNSSVEYVESDGEGWTEQRSLALGADFTAEQAFAILRRRIDS